jgi:hypothetical protein
MFIEKKLYNKRLVDIIFSYVKMKSLLAVAGPRRLALACPAITRRLSRCFVLSFPLYLLLVLATADSNH